LIEHFDINHIRRVLEGCAVPHATLDLDGGYRLVIVEHGGHALGPFDADGQSVLWLNPAAWDSVQSLSRFVGEGQWNLGGERYWLAPEIRFNVRDRADFWGSYALPAEMAPGNYRLKVAGNTASLSAEAVMPYFNPPDGAAHVSVHRRYRALPNPLRHLEQFPELNADVAYAGFSHAATLNLLTKSAEDALVESWTLAQLVPDGTIIVPCSAGVEYEDYYEPIDGEHLKLESGAVLLAITGRRRYKVGFRAPHLTGRVGFFKPIAAGRAQLIVRNFFNDPSSDYVEEPPTRPGCRGLSVHIYNDDGVLGGFGELECNGRTVGGAAGCTGSDDFAFWLFQGKEEKVRTIARLLMGFCGAA
jgi:hypothetical protein